MFFSFSIYSQSYRRHEYTLCVRIIATNGYSNIMCAVVKVGLFLYMQTVESLGQFQIML